MTAYTYALLAAAVWGITPLLEKAGLAEVQPMAGLLLRSCGVLLGFLLLIPFVPDLGFELKAATFKAALYLVLGGFLASIVGQIFSYHAIKQAEVSQVSPIMGSWPIVVVALGWLFLHEPLTVKKLLGTGLIVMGVWLLRF